MILIVGIVLAVYLLTMTYLIVDSRRSIRQQRYLVLSFMELVIFYGFNSEEVLRFRNEHKNNTQLLNQCDSTVELLKPTAREYHD